MPADEPGGERPAGPAVIRIKLRYSDIETMVQRFAPNVGKSGLFLPTRTMHPVGTEVKFELRLATDQPVLVGLGRVKELRAPDATNPRAAFGLAIELMRVTREGRDLILKMLERRRQLGLSEVALPIPSDIESARRLDVETNPRIQLPPEPPPASPTTLTSPRRASSPIDIPKITTVEPLPPEPPRKKRVGLGELIQRASGSMPAVSEDAGDAEGVDVGAVLARARTLAGHDVDGELAFLLEASAAPQAIDVEAASAELARQLGGAPVRRGDRSGRVATPTPAAPIAVPASAPEPTPEPAPAPAPDSPVAAVVEAAAIIAAPEAAPVLAAALDEVAARMSREILPPDDDAVAELAPEPITAAEAPVPPELIHDDADPAQFEAAEEVDPEQIDDEIHQLDEDDFEDVEHTYAGDQPVVDTLDPDAFDAGLARAEAEAEEEDLGFTSDGEPPAPELDEAEFDRAAAREFDSDMDDEAAEPPPVDDDGDVPPEELDLDAQEVDDFEILAENAAEDVDEEPPLDEDSLVLPPRHSVSDFALRLDLGDESDLYSNVGVNTAISSLEQDDPVAPPPARPGRPERFASDLESALEALDVDLDDLSIPHASTQRAPSGLPTKKPRAMTDDGVLINFDDDEE